MEKWLENNQWKKNEKGTEARPQFLNCFFAILTFINYIQIQRCITDGENQTINAIDKWNQSADSHSSFSQSSTHSVCICLFPLESKRITYRETERKKWIVNFLKGSAWVGFLVWNAWDLKSTNKKYIWLRIKIRSVPSKCVMWPGLSKTTSPTLFVDYVKICVKICDKI